MADISLKSLLEAQGVTDRMPVIGGASYTITETDHEQTLFIEQLDDLLIRINDDIRDFTKVSLNRRPGAGEVTLDPASTATVTTSPDFGGTDWSMDIGGISVLFIRNPTGSAATVDWIGGLR